MYMVWTTKKLIVILVMLAGCNQKPGSGFTGIYTRQSESEFSTAFDTLILFGYNKEEGTCLVRRKTGFIRKLNGIPQPREFKSENLITVPDEDMKTLEDKKTGRLISFRNGELLFGTAVYKKIK